MGEKFSASFTQQEDGSYSLKIFVEDKKGNKKEFHPQQDTKSADLIFSSLIGR